MEAAVRRLPALEGSRAVFAHAAVAVSYCSRSSRRSEGWRLPPSPLPSAVAPGGATRRLRCGAPPSASTGGGVAIHRRRWSSAVDPSEDPPDGEGQGFDGAVSLFNDGDYHSCHDVLVEIWCSRVCSLLSFGGKVKEEHVSLLINVGLLVSIITFSPTASSKLYVLFLVVQSPTIMNKIVQSSKALIPAIIYICSFAVSIILQEIKWNGWRLKVFYTTGAILWIFSGAGIFLLPSKIHNFIYLLSITTGVANALMTVTGISMESMLVGKDLNGCAFVYGSLSFLDKVSCGLALYLLESYQSSPSTDGCHDITSCQSVTRYGAGLIPAACALVGAVVTYTMNLHDTTPKSLSEPLLA